MTTLTSDGPDLTRGLLLLALLLTLGFFGCRSEAGGPAPVSKGQVLTQFESKTSGSVDLGEGLEVLDVRSGWIRLRPEGQGPDRWLNLDGLTSMTLE